MATKEDTLRKTGCFNNNYENVSAGIFKSSPFFDKKDIVQVKYEMIRAVSKEEGSITEIADVYGFSRKSYYQINEAYETGGLYALIPKKTGPKKPHKLTPEVTEFIDSYLADHKNAKALEISMQLEIEKGIKIHPRTIYRYLEKKT
jgi:transposase